jgi:hypothetical protein
VAAPYAPPVAYVAPAPYAPPVAYVAPAPAYYPAYYPATANYYRPAPVYIAPRPVVYAPPRYWAQPHQVLVPARGWGQGAYAGQAYEPYAARR